MAEKRVVILDATAPVAERLREVKVGDTTGIDVKLQAATGDEVAVNIQYEVDKLTSGNDTGLVVNQTNTSSPGVSKAIDIQQGTISKAYFDNNGNLNLPLGDTPATPALEIGGGASGFYARTAESISCSISGVRIFDITSSKMSRASSWGLDSTPPTSTVPSLLPLGTDIDTGVGHQDDQLSLIAGGVEGIRVTEAAGAIVNDLTGVATLITGHTIAGLPTPATGMIARITDGDSALAWGATAINSGSGSTPYMVWYNGTNWTVMGK